MRFILISIFLLIVSVQSQYNQGPPMNFGPPPMNFFSGGFNPMGQQGQDGQSGQFGQPGQFDMQGNQGMHCQIVCKEPTTEQTSGSDNKETVATKSVTATVVK